MLGRIDMAPSKTSLSAAYWLTAVLAALLLVSSVLGIVFGASNLYTTYPAALAGLIGQDIVSLIVGIPLLIGSAWSARRGSIGGLLAWAGTFFYLAYSYYFFLVGGFNALFLVYSAIVATSLYGLLSVMLAVDASALVQHVGPGLPRRAVSTFFGVIVALFVVMWGGMSIGAAAAGEPLEPVPHLVVAIDGAVLLPLLGVAAVKLWRREAFGDVLGGVLLIKVIATGLTLAFTQALSMLWAGKVEPFEAFLFVIFGVMAVGGLGLAVPYMRAMSRGQPSTAVRAVAAPAVQTH
jgi:hypothetical protein